MRKTIIAGIACLGLLSSCSNEADIPEYNDIKVNPVKAMWTDRPLKAIGETNSLRANEFATDLFRKTYAKEGGNTCISPASVFLTLAMTANGDDGESRDEILNLLGYDTGETGLNELNAYSNALLVEVPDFNGDTQCGFTNSLWHSPDFNLLPSFTDGLKEIFGAADVNVWLGDKTGKNALNRFVEENTRGMIKDFLKEPLQIDLGILNTTYFKGTWEKKFDNGLTRKESFRNADGSVSKTPFMELTDYMGCVQRDGVTAVRLPYAGDRYTMTFMLPERPEDFNDMVASIDGKRIRDIYSWLYPCRVELRLPKYETEINLDIIDILKEMGLDRTCHPGLMKADAGGPIELAIFKHAVRIIVNEDGTEGAAASLGGFFETSNNPQVPKKPISIRFDNPFIYLISDNISGTVLFMGAVTSF